MLYILDGVDGTGKSTLAKEIAKQKKAQIFHAGFNKEWNIKKYHQNLMIAAEAMNNDNINVVLDRWAASEKVYGTIFRDGESYDTDSLIKFYYPMLPITFIYCRNDNALENHLNNLPVRDEMFNGDKFSELIEEFDSYIKDHKWMNWVEYDYSKNNIVDFVRKLS